MITSEGVEALHRARSHSVHSVGSAKADEEAPGTLQVRCGGELCEVSEFLHTLRVRLWAEHLGLLDAEELSGARVTHQVNACDTVQRHHAEALQDAVEAYDTIWVPTAAKNTVVYESVFPEMPANSHKTLEDIRNACGVGRLEQNIYRHNNTFDTMTAIGYLNESQGNVTRMPLDFLVNHDLSMSWSKDMASGILPQEVFV